MKVSELFEDRGGCPPGHVIKNDKGTWTACNHQGLARDFDDEDTATQYANAGANDIADE